MIMVSEQNVISTTPLNAMPVDSLTNDQQTKVLGFIETMLENKIYIGDLARLVAMSQRQFVKIFKKSFGCPPKHFILKYRVERSKVEMLTTPRCLCDIALACGFADQSHFNRAFCRFTGETPHLWRIRNNNRRPAQWNQIRAQTPRRQEPFISKASWV
jgi:transcriptional regulator GlxA family with amidase domain